MVEESMPTYIHDKGGKRRGSQSKNIYIYIYITPLTYNKNINRRGWGYKHYKQYKQQTYKGECIIYGDEDAGTPKRDVLLPP